MARQYLNRPPGTLIRGADGQLGDAVAVEISSGERAAEFVSSPVHPAWKVMCRPILAAPAGQAPARAVQDVHRTMGAWALATGGAWERLLRHADRQVSATVAVE